MKVPIPIENRRVVIVGMGRTALSLAALLHKRGARPFVSEAADGARFASARAALETLGVSYECGGHTASAFNEAALIVPSPGVPPALAPIQAAAHKGVPVVSELEAASWFCREPRVLAVTGANGKTTVTELVRALVAACGHAVALAGNNDAPFSSVAAMDAPPDYVVLEVSSYQLELARSFRPWIAAVLNVTPDHLARHGTIEAYAAVKARLFAHQQPGDAAVRNADDALTAAMQPPEGVARWDFSLTQRLEHGLWLDGEVIRHGAQVVAQRADLALPGRHNAANALAALAMMRAGGFDWPRVLEGLRAFRGVEHRIEWTAAVDGVDFYNDSKATNIESLRAALESFTQPIVLIAGGEGKGSDYGVLRDLVAKRVRKLVALGEDAPKLECAWGGGTPFERAADMPDAVARAAAAAHAGDVVLLSPACASFDMYANFEERGRHFKACVRDYAAAAKEACE